MSDSYSSGAPLSGSESRGMPARIPHLSDIATSRQLVVQGKPFLIRGAELQNSSLTSADYMRPVWPKLIDGNVNTVLGCVTWEQIEPIEDRFDFSELDRIVIEARSHALHLILLWFGSWKNGLSTYAPAWVKTNPARFVRASLRRPNGRLKTADILSPFGRESQNADAKAFRTLMQHIKEIDFGHSTVIMVQVENEVGILGDSRDASPAANKAFVTSVPQDLVDHLSDHWASLHPSLQENLSRTQLEERPVRGSWAKVFGDSPQTDELFMAYHFALYVDSVAAAGKSAYALPCYVNVWQSYGAEDRDESCPHIVAGGGNEPGVYPSGGGVVNVLDIWQRFAPHIDFVAPDIYLNDYTRTSEKYRHRNQPLFIPEQRRDEYGARRIWKAFGSYQAIGTAPFGFDTVEVEHGCNPFKRHYGLLRQVEQIVLGAHRKPGSSIGFFFDEPAEDGKVEQLPISATFGAWQLSIERSFVFGKQSPGSGMVIHLGEARFVLIGWGFQVSFKSTSPKAHFSGILRFLEKEVVDEATGETRIVRWLNGDETRSGTVAIMPSENPDYGGFPISITIPARTGIAEVECYALEEPD